MAARERNKGLPHGGYPDPWKKFQWRGWPHIDAMGKVRMVDVGKKQATERRAIAGCEIQMRPETFELLRKGSLQKGDAFAAAQIAGILAAKKTPELIPLCHPLPLEKIEIRFFDRPDRDGVFIESEVRACAKTGVEMEALTAATAAALTLYDMAKGRDPAMVITNLHLIQKSGGKNSYVYSHQSGNHHGK